MKILRRLCVTFLCWQAPFAAAELLVLDIGEMMTLPDVVKSLDPAVKLLWGDQAMQDVAERAPEERFSDHSRVGDRCKNAFAGTIAKLVAAGKEMGYDQVWMQGSPYKGGKNPEAGKFFCDDGFLYAGVALSVRLATSKAEQKRQQMVRNDPERKAAIAAQVAQRKAVGNTVFLSLSSLLESPEAKAMLRGGESVHWGRADPPAYELRKGPDRYSEDASYKEHGRDKACHAAGLRAFKEMVENMREVGFNAIIRVNSRLNDLPALDDEYECKMDTTQAEVRLFATLAKKSGP